VIAIRLEPPSLPRRLGEALQVARAYYRIRRQIRPFFGESFGQPLNGQRIRRQTMGELLAGFRPDAVIETGTFLGWTARYLASHGEGVHHVCFLTDDLPASLEALAAAEAELIDREPRPGARGTVLALCWRAGLRPFRTGHV
jgi:hypothetical protein